MNRDTILRLKHEAGFQFDKFGLLVGEDDIDGDGDYDDAFERFAALVLADKWLPIETAPKDGSARILLCVDHGEHGDKVWTGLWADGWILCYGRAVGQPTHWQPIPAPPSLTHTPPLKETTP